MENLQTDARIKIRPGNYPSGQMKNLVSSTLNEVLVGIEWVGMLPEKILTFRVVEKILHNSIVFTKRGDCIRLVYIRTDFCETN